MASLGAPGSQSSPGGLKKRESKPRVRLLAFSCEEVQSETGTCRPDSLKFWSHHLSGESSHSGTGNVN